MAQRVNCMCGPSLYIKGRLRYLQEVVLVLECSSSVCCPRVLPVEVEAIELVSMHIDCACVMGGGMKKV